MADQRIVSGVVCGASEQTYPEKLNTKTGELLPARTFRNVFISEASDERPTVVNVEDPVQFAELRALYLDGVNAAVELTAGYNGRLDRTLVAFEKLELPARKAS